MIFTLKNTKSKSLPTYTAVCDSYLNLVQNWPSVQTLPVRSHNFLLIYPPYFLKPLAAVYHLRINSVFDFMVLLERHTHTRARTQITW